MVELFAQVLHWPWQSPSLNGSLLSELEFKVAQYLEMHVELVASLAIPGGCAQFMLRVCSAYHTGKEAGLPDPAESLSKPVKSTNHPAAEHAYSWPFASFDL